MVLAWDDADVDVGTGCFSLSDWVDFLDFGGSVDDCSVDPDLPEADAAATFLVVYPRRAFLSVERPRRLDDSHDTGTVLDPPGGGEPGEPAAALPMAEIFSRWAQNDSSPCA